jgi:hypothetical protein
MSIKKFLYFLLFLFFAKPNFDTIPLAARMGDAVCILLLGSIYLIVSYKKLPDMKSLTLPFACLLFSYFTSIVFCLFNFSSYIVADINEVFRVPLFMILPIFIGKYLVQGDEYAFNKFCNFFVLLYVYNLAVIIFQFSNIFGKLTFILYAQRGLTAARVTGVSLFMAECAWIVYTTTALIVVYRYKTRRKKIAGMILSSPSLLTLSKTVYLSYIVLLLFFSYNKKGKASLKSIMPNILLLLVIGSVLLYLLKDNLQFIVSILEGFSSNSKSVSARQGQIIRLFDSLSNNEAGYLFGVSPILSYLGVRVETSFFNIFAKIGIFGTITYYCCINLLLFVKQKGPGYIVLLKRIIMGIGISLSLVSVTGGSIEGVKGMFFYFLVIGVLLSYNTNTKNHEYSICR